MKSVPGWEKDDKGAYIKKVQPISPPVPEPDSNVPDPNVSLDDISKRVIVAMDRATKTLLQQITNGDVSREVIGALKDCQVMLKDLRKDEKEFLDSLSDDQLERLKVK